MPAPDPFASTRPVRVRWGMIAVLLAALAILPATSHAQSYSQLQVLLPGESAAPGTVTGKSGVPEHRTVGVPFSVQVRAVDASWNLQAGVTNSVDLDSSDESATLPGTFVLAGGEATVDVTLQAAGTFTVSADDLTDGTIPLATSAPVDALLLAGFEFARINQKNQYAGVPMTATVTAVDPVGETVPYSGNVVLRELTSFGPGRLEPAVVTLVDGSWEGPVTNYRADETSINRGNVNLEASLPSDPSINGLSDPFTVHPGVHARVQIVLPGETPLPGSVAGVTGSPASQAAGESFAVEVYATDDWWNPVPSADAVRITSSDPAASTPVSGALAGGVRMFTLSLGTTGTQTLTVTDTSNGAIAGMTSAPVPVGASAPHHFEIDPIAGPLTAGAAVSVTIRATDVAGNTIPDYAGNAILTANTGLGSISPELIVFSAGEWTGDMVFRGAGGAVSFSVSDFSSPPHTGTSASFEVLPGPFVKLQVVVDGETPAGGTATGVAGAPASQAAGSSFPVRVRAVDEFFNRVPGVTDRVALTSTDLFAGLPDTLALANGESLVDATLYRAGTQIITATDVDAPSIAPHTSSGVPVEAGPYARILLLAPGEDVAPGTEEGRTGTATDQSINFSFNVTVHATDAWFNPVGTVTDRIRLTSGDPLAELPPDTDMVAGSAVLPVRLATGGFQQVTAANVTSPGMPPSTTQVRAISSGFHLEAEVAPTRVMAGEAFTLTVKVTNDAGAVIQEINSTVSVAVRNASSGEPGRGTLLNGSFQLLQGERAVQETYTAAESIVLVVTDDAGNEPAVTEVVFVDPGPPAAVVLESDPEWVRGNRHATVTARVVDAYDNGVPGRPVDFSLVTGSAMLTPIDGATGTAGDARADFLSPRHPEIATVRAVSEGLSATLDIETALVDPDEGAGYVTSYPNPFHPGEAPVTIAYKLSADATVKLSFYSILGTPVRREEIPAGSPGGREGLNEILWDGRNGTGDVVASGGYVVVIEAVGDGETLHTMRRRIAVVR